MNTKEIMNRLWRIRGNLLCKNIEGGLENISNLIKDLETESSAQKTVKCKCGEFPNFNGIICNCCALKILCR